MAQDPARYLNPSKTKADFTYAITVKGVKIQDTGKGRRSVAEDLEAVLRKIEGWHQGSITGFLISYRDTKGIWHRVSWDGKEATEKGTCGEGRLTGHTGPIGQRLPALIRLI